MKQETKKTHRLCRLCDGEEQHNGFEIVDGQQPLRIVLGMRTLFVLFVVVLCVLF